MEHINDAIATWHSYDPFTNPFVPTSFTNLAAASAAWILLTVLVASVFDNLLKLILPKSGGHNGRWFTLHTLFNFLIVFLTFPGALKTLANPLHVFKETCDNIGHTTTVVIAGFHLYHALAYPLTSEDIWHHIINTGVAVAVGVGSFAGVLLNLCNLMMCGLPGGIDYGLLALVKFGVIEKLTEKKINRLLNLVLRYPLMYLTMYIVLLNYVRGTHVGSEFQFWLTVFGCSLHVLNAWYFCDKVVGNYHVTMTTLRQQKKDAKVAAAASALARNDSEDDVAGSPPASPISRTRAKKID